ncbi:hypothetical protein BH09PAT1_BH09PAT1_3090 [soil metagenome]
MDNFKSAHAYRAHVVSSFPRAIIPSGKTFVGYSYTEEVMENANQQSDMDLLDSFVSKEIVGRIIRTLDEDLKREESLEISPIESGVSLTVLIPYESPSVRFEVKTTTRRGCYLFAAYVYTKITGMVILKHFGDNFVHEPENPYMTWDLDNLVRAPIMYALALLPSTYWVQASEATNTPP